MKLKTNKLTWILYIQTFETKLTMDIKNKVNLSKNRKRKRRRHVKNSWQKEGKKSFYNNMLC